MGDKIEFFVLDLKYKIVNNKVEVSLFSRTMDGKSIVVIDDSFEPYFYVVSKKGVVLNDKLEKLKVEKEGEVSEVVKTENVKRNFLGKEVDAVKVFTKLPRDIPVIMNLIKEWEIIENINEYDIPFIRRYLVDKGIIPMTLLEAEVEEISRKAKVPVFRALSIGSKEDETLVNPQILAFDIETYNPDGKTIDFEKNPIIMLSFYGAGFKKVFTWKRFETNEDYVEFVESEADLIQKFKETVEKLNPDLLAGYYSDGFDLPYIHKRASKYKIKLDLGLDYSDLNVSKRKISKAKIAGIVHLDVLNVIKKMFSLSLKTNYYDLDSVSEEMINEKKLDVDLDGLAKAWDQGDKSLSEYCSYNLRDSKLVFLLAEKIMPNIIEMVKTVGLPLYEVTRMGFSQLVEWYLIKQAKAYNEICPNKPSYDVIRDRMLNNFKGGFVFEPKPGLYKEVVIFDFRSLYPTIISSHNISLGMFNCDCCKESVKHIPIEGEDYWFCEKRKGFLSIVIEGLIKRRMRIKEMMKSSKNDLLEARQNNLKVLANAFYGYFGFFNARWYSVECARSITALGRDYIHKVIAAAEKEGFNVVYSDSLPYDRHIFVKFKNEEIKIIKIGELYDKYKNENSLSTLTFNKNHKTVFKPILKIIRHSYEGKGHLLKIKTRYGSTVVTPQHSVYSFSKKLKLVDANQLKIGDKLISLTNVNIKPTHKENHIFDLVNLDFDKYQEELMLYSDNLPFPNKKGICPYCNKEVTLSSHVFCKHPERRHELDKNSLFTWMGGKNGKTRKIPRYWTLDKDLSWLLGFYCAEGSLSDVKTRSGRKCMLSFGSQDINIIQKVKEILDEKTTISTKIIKNYDPRNKKYMYYYRVQCMPIVALFLFGFGAGKESEFKKVPWFIFTSEETLRRSFIEGYLEGDGNSSVDKRYKTHFRRFSTKSKELAEGLCFIFKTLDHGKNLWKKKIKHVAWQYRKDKPKIQTLRVQSAKESKGNFCLAEIRSIEKVSNEKYVYDIEVKDSHNFVDAEGMILVHNTDSIFLSLEGKSKTDAKQFAESINPSLPGMMDLEYEGFYPVALFVSAKAGAHGAKKKYALLTSDNQLLIKGFETVRRNWSIIAKEVQEKVLNIVLKENNPDKALRYVRSVIEDLKECNVPLDKVTIRTQLKKEIESYASVGPHVAVAKRLRSKGFDIVVGMAIEFVVTEGKGNIGDRARLPNEIKNNKYDSDYYINNQVLPSVERIFEVLGYKKEDLILDKKQSNLSSFMG